MTARRGGRRQLGALGGTDVVEVAASIGRSSFLNGTSQAATTMSTKSVAETGPFVVIQSCR
jgi:hypothetical protein